MHGLRGQVDRERQATHRHRQGRRHDLLLDDVADDAMRVGAILAKWQAHEDSCSHYRGEARCAKAEDNELVPSHKVDVPPPPLLQYLRYFLNLYGLNCNVTATHFPTLLLEEDLWGFFGSVGQNSRAGLSVSASYQEIQRQMGAFFLPKHCPRLGGRSAEYMGVEHLFTWVSPRHKVETSLQIGANHSSLKDGSDFETVVDADEANAIAEINAAQMAKKKKKAASRGPAEEAQVRHGRRPGRDRCRAEGEGGRRDRRGQEERGGHPRCQRRRWRRRAQPRRRLRRGRAGGRGGRGRGVVQGQGQGAKKKKKTQAELAGARRKPRSCVRTDVESITDHFSEWYANDVPLDLNVVKGISDGNPATLSDVPGCAHVPSAPERRHQRHGHGVLCAALLALRAPAGH